MRLLPLICALLLAGCVEPVNSFDKVPLVDVGDCLRGDGEFLVDGALILRVIASENWSGLNASLAGVDPYEESFAWALSGIFWKDASWRTSMDSVFLGRPSEGANQIQTFAELPLEFGDELIVVVATSGEASVNLNVGRSWLCEAHGVKDIDLQIGSQESGVNSQAGFLNASGAGLTMFAIAAEFSPLGGVSWPRDVELNLSDGSRREFNFPAPGYSITPALNQVEDTSLESQVIPLFTFPLLADACQPMGSIRHEINAISVGSRIVPITIHVPWSDGVLGRLNCNSDSE